MNLSTMRKLVRQQLTVLGLKKDKDKDLQAQTWWNPEAETAQKRQWEKTQKPESHGISFPEHCFEHLIVVGLPPSADVSALTRSALADRASAAETKSSPAYAGPRGPTYNAELLFVYPPGKVVNVDNIAQFCFPHGVEARLCERTPSMSEMNELVYGQGHLHTDDQSFIFLLKGPGGVNLYGVCVVVHESVHNPPGVLLAAAVAACASSTHPHHLPPHNGPHRPQPAPSLARARYTVSAPRCYCLLTRAPFFRLHFEVLHLVLAQERLLRIQACVDEMNSFLTVSHPLSSPADNEDGTETPDSESAVDCTVQWVFPKKSANGGAHIYSALEVRSDLSSHLTAEAVAGSELSTGRSVQADTPREQLQGSGGGLAVAGGGTMLLRGDAREAEPRARQVSDDPANHNDSMDSVSNVSGSSCTVVHRAHAQGVVPSAIIRSIPSDGATTAHNGRTSMDLKSAEHVGSRHGEHRRGLPPRPPEPNVARAQPVSIHEQPSTSSQPASGRRRTHQRAHSDLMQSLPGSAMLRDALKAFYWAYDSSDGGDFSRGWMTNHRRAAGGGMKDGAASKLGAHSNFGHGGGSSSTGGLETCRPQEAPAVMKGASKRARFIHRRTGSAGPELVSVRGGAHSRSGSGDVGLVDGLPSAAALLIDPPPVLDARIGGSSAAHAQQAGEAGCGGEGLKERLAPREEERRRARERQAGVSGRAGETAPLENGRELATKGKGSKRSKGTKAKKRGRKHEAGEGAWEEGGTSARLARGIATGHGISPQQAQELEERYVQTSDALRVLREYHRLHVPARGELVTFQPLPHIPPVDYIRWKPEPAAAAATVALPLSPLELLRLEEVNALELWTVAAVCRALSLPNVIAMLTAALLERQTVVVCPNAGILSATVLSLIPMLRPFTWQSVMLPSLPNSLLALMDAPVPFVVGVAHKSPEVRQHCGHLCRINVYKDRVKMTHFPPIPRHKELAAALAPLHKRLMSAEEAGKLRPVDQVSGEQREAAQRFLCVLREHLNSLCADLRTHTITDVRTKDKVSLLLKDSYIESFPRLDRQFMRMFVETQMFSAYSDDILKTDPVSSLSDGTHADTGTSHSNM